MKNRIKVTCGVIEKAGKYLIVQRGAKTSDAFKWEFPGGKVELGETEKAGMARELKEELDIDVLVETPLLPIEREKPRCRIELLPFRCTIIGGEITLLEHIAMAWIDIHEPIEYDLSEGDYEIINQLKNKESFE